MAGIKTGDKVAIKYVGTMDNGEVFDKSGDDSPLEFTIGNHEIIPGLENALVGMKKGEKKKIKVKAEEAYGQRYEKNVRKLPLASLPPGMKVEKDMMLMAGDGNGHQLPVRVIDADKDSFTIDFNHPFAGKDLTFDVEIVSVN